MVPRSLRLDEIGPWSEVKLDIVRKYAQAYSSILASQTSIRRHLYIDAFAGAGVHISKATGEQVPGSPLIALDVQPPFAEYHLIDLDDEKVANLEELVGDRPNVKVYGGDCNTILLRDVFPRARYEDYARALCILDPYGLSLNWEVVAAAGTMGTVDIFVNFPIMDINRNVLLSKPETIEDADLQRMNAFWGDETWREAAYQQQGTLFGDPEPVKPGGNVAIIDAYRERLKTVAGFRNVPQPMVMRNSIGAAVYYLFFASQKDVANKVLSHIFNKHRGSA